MKRKEPIDGYPDRTYLKALVINVALAQDAINELARRGAAASYKIILHDYHDGLKVETRRRTYDLLRWLRRKSFVVNAYVHLNFPFSKWELYVAVAACMASAESHELAEGLSCRGGLIFNPHDDDARVLRHTPAGVLLPHVYRSIGKWSDWIDQQQGEGG